MSRERPHASVQTCERDACLAAAYRWVAGETNETAVFYSFDTIWWGKRS